MTIPDYQTVMLPLLRFAADGQEHSLREAIEKLADHFGLSDEERKALLPSGRPRVKSTFYRRTLLACQSVEILPLCPHRLQIWPQTRRFFCFFGASGARFVVTFGSVPTFSTGWQAYYLAFATRPHHSQIRSAAAGCN
jgi:hypothetical protein